MNFVPLTFLTILSIISQVWCVTKKACDLSDDVCILQASRLMNRQVIAGIPEMGISTSDPIHRDIIETAIPTAEYTLTDAYMHGMKKCSIKKIRINFQMMTWHCDFNCPRIVISSNYKIKGDIASIEMEGEGHSELSFSNYNIGLVGTHEIYTGANDKPYMNVTSYKLDSLDVLGPVTYDFQNLFNGDTVKSESAHNLLRENWKVTSDVIQQPIMHSFLGKYLDGINAYLKATCIEDSFYHFV